MDSKENKSTPAATWRINGEPDPHGMHYDGERAVLAMGHLTDDEMANAIFMNYDANPSPEEMLAGTGFRPIVWATAAKERIRWLSRALVKATATASGAAPQVVADERAYTAEEAREQFMDQVRHYVSYWERESRAPTAKEKLEGLAFSIMNIFDGTSGLPAFDIVCAPHPDDKQYYIDEGSKYFVPGMVINKCYLHEMLFNGRAAAPAQAQEPVLVQAFEESGSDRESGAWFDIAASEAKSYADEGYKVRKLVAAPVQPVAVPDGALREVVGKVIKAMESSAAPIDLAHALGEVSRQGGRINFDADLMAELLAAYSASPAAQCDALSVLLDNMFSIEVTPFDVSIVALATEAERDEDVRGEILATEPWHKNGPSLKKATAKAIERAIAAKAAS